jgi:integrase
MLKNTKKRSADKPRKPYPDFPLFPHRAGVWAKKIRGKTHYFGPWADPDAALAKYLDQRDDLHAGRTPRVSGDGLEIRDLLNRYLTAKEALADSGEIAQTTFAEYHRTCERIGEAFGLNRLVSDLAAEDFEGLRKQLAEAWGPVRLGNEIGRIKSVFKYGYESGITDRPARYGPSFKKPSAKVLRKQRATRGSRLVEPAEVHALLAVATPMMRAMILLGLNCGYGNTDCATLPLAALNLQSGWVDYPRPKTGVPRRCPLWPETVAALKAAIASRPEGLDEDKAGLVFISARHKSYAGEWSHRLVASEMARLAKRAGVKRAGLSFYGLRHSFQTIGDAARDPVATMAIMGHAAHVNDMGAVYRETVSDDRLQAVVGHVRNWLFDGEKSN